MTDLRNNTKQDGIIKLEKKNQTNKKFLLSPSITSKIILFLNKYMRILFMAQ